MLSKKETAILLIVTFIPFSLYLFSPNLVGVDGYAFLNQVCGINQVLWQPTGIYPILDLLPCNITAIKVVLFLMMFSCVLILALIGKSFNKKNGYLAGILVWFAPVLLSEFIKFENDQFAYPFLFAACYFFLKARHVKLKSKDDNIAWSRTYQEMQNYDFLAAFMIGISLLFWQGGVYLVLAFALSSILFTVLAAIALLLYAPQIISAATPIMGVYESQPLLGLVHLFLLLVGIVGFKKEFKRQGIFLLILNVFTAKFMILAVPFLSLGMLNVWNELEEKKPKIKGLLLGAFIGLFLIWGFLPVYQWQYPAEHHWEAIDFALAQTDDNHIQNDWSYGYWVQHKGGITESFGGGELIQDFNEGIVLTAREQDCRELKKFEELFVYLC